MATAVGRLLVAGLVCGGAAAPRRKGGRPGSSSPDEHDISKAFDLTPDPRDPHSQGFVPRPHPDESGDIWAFGKAHATVHHVLKGAPEGDAEQTLDLFEAFSAEHKLSFGLGHVRAFTLDHMMRALVAGGSEAEPRALRVLVLGAGLGGRALRCLPVLLATTPASNPGYHELVSVERDAYLSSGGSQLVEHAIHGSEVVHHLPLMPGKGTTLEEVVDSLNEGYGLSSFDVVLLENGGRARQREELDTLVRSNALHCNAVVHAEGPGLESADTGQYVSLLEEIQSVHEVSEVGGGDVAIIARLNRCDGKREL